MEITQEQRDERFKSASAEAKELYSSGEKGLELRAIFEKHQLEPTSYKIYAVTVGDIILGFYPKSQLPILLHQNIVLPEGIAQQLANDLESFLVPISESDAVPTPRAVTQTTLNPISTSSPTIPSTTQAEERLVPVVPRYAKPLTEMPRYNDTQQQ